MKLYKHVRKSKIKLVVLAVVSYQLIFPNQTLAAEPISSVLLPNLTVKSSNLSQNNDNSVNTEDRIVLISMNGVTKMDNSQNNAEISQNKPSVGTAVKAYNIKKTYKVPISAYSSTVDQTDASPCITANGFNVCENNEENVIAANFLPFGTKVQIPDHFGDRIFIVQDRMNARYTLKVDIWMKSRDAALQWGVRTATIVVVE
jgi:3D (Asp-Asp-Asp) domain-containing protein